jgi:predicted acyltransferase
MSQRWLALDALRGLSIIFMLLNLNPAAWEWEYDWLQHARWQGGHFIDLVAPAFLFCIGAALPLSLIKRFESGQSRANLIRHVLLRAGLLVLIGLFLNAWPRFDFAHLRIPGVLQRIGLAYALCGLFLIAVGGKTMQIKARDVAIAIFVILISYFALLQWVPVPGFGAPRFDPVGSWPAFIDRTFWTTDHMFIYWPVDGKVVFDPDGLLTTWPVCASLLMGALTVLVRPHLKRPILTFAVSGLIAMLIAVALYSLCPIIKNIWTPTYAVFAGGASLLALCLLEPIADTPLGFPMRVYGSNPLLAYILCFLISPVFDIAWPSGTNFRYGTQAVFAHVFEPHFASLLFGLIYVTLMFLFLLFCHRRRWFLRL